MNIEFVDQLIQCFTEYKCKVKIKNDILFLNFDGQPSERKYLINLFEVDGAGTLGLKITWSLGEKIASLLVINYEKFQDMGPLYGAILPMKDDSIRFLLVGQLIFPPGTPAQDVVTILFNNAFMNYTMFELSVPGVKMFE